MDAIISLWQSFLGWFPDIVVAAIYLLLAFFAAWLAKKIVVAILKKIEAGKILDKTGIKDEKTNESIEVVGKLVFLVIFLLFLPAVLGRLGMGSVAQPITDVVSSIIAFLPELLAAGVVLVIGFFVAKIVRQLLKSLLDRSGINKMQQKLGVEEVKDKNTFSSVISMFVYVVILIPIIIAALQILGLDIVADPATSILNQIFGYLPQIFVAILLVIVGYYLAKLIAPLVESLLVSIGADRINEKISPVSENKKYNFSISKIVGQVVRFLIIIIFFVEAINLLQFEVMTQIGAAVLGYLPLAVSAIIILGGGILLANWLESVILKNSPQRKMAAALVKITIIVVAAFMTLSQLGFAQSIINYAFIILLAGLSVAFAVSFGIGGRTFAANRLAKLEHRIEEESDEGGSSDKSLISKLKNNKKKE